jgi:hypothetical protein
MLIESVLLVTFVTYGFAIEQQESLIMRFLIIWMCLWFGVGVGAHAQTAMYDKLYTALHLNDIVEIIRDEGIDEANTMAKIYLNSQGQIETFGNDIDTLYNLTNLSTFVLDGMSSRLTENDAEVALVFYNGLLGAKIARLEASARLAISDSAVESMSIEIANSAGSQASERYKVLKKNMEQLDLVEHNMKGAFASQYGFLTELSKAADINLSQDQILSMLSGSEEELREEVSAWLMGYSYMAYQPLNDDDLQLYLDFLVSPSGKALNEALFGVFNALSVKTAGVLGQLIVSSRSVQDL